MKPGDLDFLVDAARAYAGLVLRGERAYLVDTRLAPVARREGDASIDGLVARLRDAPTPALMASVVEALAPSDTTFFRDRAVFAHLAAEILPALAARRAGGVVRVWCAGAGPGQEVYSLGLLAAANPAMAGVDLQLFASDISERALQKARSGVYTHFEVQRGLPIRLLLEHFTRADDGMWRISPRLRQQVRWARINLVDDFSAMGPFDVILCRNVLSHLEPHVAEAVLGRLDRVIARDGWLVLGATEAAVHPPVAFEGEAGVYRRNAAFMRSAA